LDAIGPKWKLMLLHEPGIKPVDQLQPPIGPQQRVYGFSIWLAEIPILVLQHFEAIDAVVHDLEAFVSDAVRLVVEA
jgi:hypothetical protein